MFVLMLSCIDWDHKSHTYYLTAGGTICILINPTRTLTPSPRHSHFPPWRVCLAVSSASNTSWEDTSVRVHESQLLLNRSPPFEYHQSSPKESSPAAIPVQLQKCSNLFAIARGKNLLPGQSLLIVRYRTPLLSAARNEYIVHVLRASSWCMCPILGNSPESPDRPWIFSLRQT